MDNIPTGPPKNLKFPDVCGLLRKIQINPAVVTLLIFALIFAIAIYMASGGKKK
jgi:hypothetical protein